MNLYIRLFYMLIASFFKPKAADPFDETSLDFWVLPNDLDLNGHMNNGRYLTIMDIGRMDFVLRLTGLAAYVIKNKYIPVLSGATMRYRLPLLPFQKYVLKTRVLCWDDKWVYMEHRFIIRGGKKDGAVAAIGLVKGSFFSKEKRTTIPTGEIMTAIGQTKPSPAIPAYIAKWSETEESLREEMAQEPK
ncbi:MAG: Mesenchymal stem cell protein DSCD75 [Micavibrio aeruginosavorus]|uniref:Mesenchymal stem cell protein DSCD75 n=1 Tax=Micavibrio aeruginosavorus TaxID=349221 RepID=A0A2W5N3M6_9BACT|nr:MAG: Mesenchymal stem cell protein DSCD75 [Micavibrio aeruginosavorus]